MKVSTSEGRLTMQQEIERGFDARFVRGGISA
jgi:hypothetical protein